MTFEPLVFLFLFEFQVNMKNTGPDSEALLGKMVLTKKKEIGAIGTVDGERITISLFQGKKNTIWRPLLRPNGRQRMQQVNKKDIVQIFDLTNGLRLPSRIQSFL